MTWTADLLDPLYEDNYIATDAVLTTASGTEVALRAIDKTKGVTVGGDVSLQTIVPIAQIRVAELPPALDLGAEIQDATIALNGRTWKVTNFKSLPVPDADPTQGELVLYLQLAEDAL